MDRRILVDIPRTIVTHSIAGPRDLPEATVVFSQGADAYSVPRAAFAHKCETQMLHRALMSSRPLFVETRAGLVVRILEPFATRVTAIESSDTEQRTRLLRLSHSSRTASISVGDPAADAWLDELQLALSHKHFVTVACDDAHRIVWVSRDTSGFRLPISTPENLEADAAFFAAQPAYPRASLNADFRAIKKARCDNAMDPLCVAYTADNYCWALAHKTAIELAVRGREAGKLFLFAPAGGKLKLSTDQRANGVQEWGRHVAAFVMSRDEDGVTRRRVFDPFVFFCGDPGTQDEWLQALGATGVVPYAKRRQVYDIDPDGCVDLNSTKCEDLDSAGMDGALDSAWCNLKGLLASGTATFGDCPAPLV